MKNMFESAEMFEAYAVIDYGNYMIKLLLEDLEKPRTPIERMVDKATRYDRKQVEDLIVQGIVIVEDLIKNKKLIEADCTASEELLAQLRELLKKNQENEKG